MRFTLAFILCFSIVSCTDTAPPELSELVETEMVPYFERFANEAALRGIDLDWSSEMISASLTDIAEDKVGQCLTYNNGTRQINIDKVYWNKSSDMEREFLIFHELGHCVLSRSHLDQEQKDGTCTSIMSSGESSCRKNYTLLTRTQYLDELFS